MKIEYVYKISSGMYSIETDKRGVLSIMLLLEQLAADELKDVANPDKTRKAAEYLDDWRRLDKIITEEKEEGAKE